MSISGRNVIFLSNMSIDIKTLTGLEVTPYDLFDLTYPRVSYRWFAGLPTAAFAARKTRDSRRSRTGFLWGKYVCLIVRNNLFNSEPVEMLCSFFFILCGVFVHNRGFCSRIISFLFEYF